MKNGSIERMSSVKYSDRTAGRTLYPVIHERHECLNGTGREMKDQEPTGDTEDHM